MQIYKRVQYTSHYHKFHFSPSIHIHLNTTIQHNMQLCFAVDTQLHWPQVLTNIFSQQSNTQFVYVWFHCIYNIGTHVNYQNIHLTRLSFISHFITLLIMVKPLILISSHFLKLFVLSSYAISSKNVFLGEISVLRLFNFKNVHQLISTIQNLFLGFATQNRLKLSFYFMLISKYIL